MRILVFCQTFPLNPLDNTAHFMMDFCKGIRSAGNDVFVLLPYHINLKPKSFKNFKVVYFKYIWPERFHLLGYGQTLENNQKFKPFVFILAPFYYFFGMLALFRAIRQFRIDLVSSHWILPNGFITGVVNLLTGIPFVVSLPGTDVYVAKMNAIFNLMAKFALRRAKSVVTNSPALLEDLNVKGEVMAYGVPKNMSKRVLHKGVIIAGAGRRVANKNFERLLKIEPVAEIISGLTIDEFRKKLLGVDIFVAPSIRDKSGNLDDGNVVVLEAMAAGCAVITSDLPGYRKMIEDGRSGFLVNINNENLPAGRQELKNILERLKKDGVLRKRIGREAKKRVAKYFTNEKVGAFYGRVFEEVMYK